MSSLIGLGGALIGFGIVVAFHELGHFLGGLITKSAMDEFSVGIGTKIYGRMFGGMQFNLRLLPLGGFVKFATLASDLAANDETPEALSASRLHTNRSFNCYLENKNPWQRLLVFLMGPAFSTILCPLCFLFVFMYLGVSEISIVNVESGSLAEHAGLNAGDILIGINDQKATGASLLIAQLAETRPGEQVNLEILRNKRTHSILLSPFDNDGKVKLGVMLQDKRMPASFKKAGHEAILHSINITHRMFHGLGVIFSGNAKSDSVSGPAGILQGFSTSAKAGLAPFISFMGILSLNVAIFNMLPFPPLDGGNIVVNGFEALTTRKLPVKAVNYLRAIFTLLLFGLFILSLFTDLKKF